MPATEPGPLGTCSAYAAHPVPTRLAPGLAIGLGATEVVAAIAVVLVVAASGDAGSLEHAAAPKIATAVRAAAAIAFRCIVFMTGPTPFVTDGLVAVLVF